MVVKAMKNDDALAYGSNIWTNGNTLHPEDLDIWDSTNAVFPSYNSLSGKEIMLRIGNGGSVMIIDFASKSDSPMTAKEMAQSPGDALYTEFYNGSNSNCNWASKSRRASSWNLQRAAMAKGANLVMCDGNSKIRFGIIAENEQHASFDGSSYWDSAVGIGLDLNASGNLNAGNSWWESYDCSKTYGRNDRDYEFRKTLMFIR